MFYYRFQPLGSCPRGELSVHPSLPSTNQISVFFRLCQVLFPHSSLQAVEFVNTVISPALTGKVGLVYLKLILLFFLDSLGTLITLSLHLSLLEFDD